MVTRLKSPIHVEYDTTLGHHLIAVARVKRRDAEVGPYWELWQNAFLTMGHGMNLFHPHIDGDWKKTNAGWVADVHPKSALGKLGIMEVLVTEHIILKDEDCASPQAVHDHFSQSKAKHTG